MDLRKLDLEENRRRMRNGQLYFCFAPDLIADRKRCSLACKAFNAAADVPRRRLVELFQAIQNDKTPLPPPAPTPEEDEDLLANYVWCDGPIKMDYGYNVKFGENVYVNSNSTWVDSSLITVGARTLIGPNCSFYSGNHPTDSRVRNGTNGPEDGAPITIGEDCWFGGNCIVLPGVTIGRGSTIGAGTVVTKDIPPNVVAVGNPARILREVTPTPADQLPPGFNPYDSGSSSSS
ncbi:hypothetical protein DL764_003852 [Monosporascus ibericus]|uniref:Maltose/galactoside acetyltransferase domain-containing protein n=1 Tax=Monosporascus ibericus TaxID=155417 RepID=A0A4V1XB84_9PEZI|nr:hypothetical protein DL764_003852 [Monosporascus ibericus]